MTAVGWILLACGCSSGALAAAMAGLIGGITGLKLKESTGLNALFRLSGAIQQALPIVALPF
jgi:hypothetical protein